VSTAARGKRTAEVKANALVVKRFKFPVGPVGCKISPFDAFSSELASYMHIQRARDSLSKQCFGLRLFPKLVTTKLYELTFEQIVSQDFPVDDNDSTRAEEKALAFQVVMVMVVVHSYGRLLLLLLLHSTFTTTLPSRPNASFTSCTRPPSHTTT